MTRELSSWLDVRLVKYGLHWQNFPGNDALITAVKQWFITISAEFYNFSMYAVVYHWKKCVAKNCDYIET